MIRFKIDQNELLSIGREFQASEKQIGLSISRALSRTAGTMRRRAEVALKSEFDVRRANTIRKRLKALRVRRQVKRWEVSLWVGLNDLRITDLKGKPSETSTGAKFRDQDYAGAFVAKSRRGPASIFKRSGRGRFPIVEQTYPIKDRADIVLEDDVFADLVDVFMANFRADLRARTVFGVGER
jgi:hypothetical protein